MSLLDDRSQSSVTEMTKWSADISDFAAHVLPTLWML